MAVLLPGPKQAVVPAKPSCFPTWARTALSNTRFQAPGAEPGHVGPRWPPTLSPSGVPCRPHSPFFSALCFGGSGSGRHGQGPSQSTVRRLPVEQAWNSNLHCKTESKQAFRRQLRKPPPGSLRNSQCYAKPQSGSWAQRQEQGSPSQLEVWIAVS